jgi:hypothetical protein
MEQCVPKRRHIKFRRRGITQKKAYDIQNTEKVWNQELYPRPIKSNLAITTLNDCQKNNHVIAALVQHMLWIYADSHLSAFK